MKTVLKLCYKASKLLTMLKGNTVECFSFTGQNFCNFNISTKLEGSNVSHFLNKSFYDR